MHTCMPSDHVSVDFFTYRTQESGVSNLGLSPSEFVNATLNTLRPPAGSCPRGGRREEAWELSWSPEGCEYSTQARGLCISSTVEVAPIVRVEIACLLQSVVRSSASWK